MKVATYKTPTGYTLYTKEILNNEFLKQINVNVACKNTGIKENPLAGGIAVFIGILDLSEVENANKINTKRGRMVIDLVNDEVNKAKKYISDLQKMELEIEKLQKKVTSGKNSLNKKRGAAYEEKELQVRFKIATTQFRRSFGEMTDEEIKNALRERIRQDFQRDYAEWEELVTKLGKLNYEFSQKYEMKQY
jgi:hypothetical protein